MNLNAFILGLGALIVFYALWAVYARLTYREQAPDALGRIIIMPGLVSWLLALFSAALFFLFGTMTALAATGQIEDWLYWILLGTPLTALMGFSVYIITWARLRVSSTMVEYRGLRGWKIFKWDQVNCVDSHSGLGTRLQIIGFRPKYFWAYGYGAEQIKEIFNQKGIPFDIA